MSHHILHVFQHGAVLGRERGFITCKADGQAERRLPLDDVRAVIIAARGVTISSNFLSGLLETDAIVLHCDERYQPCGWTAPLARVVACPPPVLFSLKSTMGQRNAFRILFFRAASTF
jgi:CRISPR-associated protein Cas1